jgi:hypothetical protein
MNQAGGIDSHSWEEKEKVDRTMDCRAAIFGTKRERARSARRRVVYTTVHACMYARS